MGGLRARSRKGVEARATRPAEDQEQTVLETCPVPRRDGAVQEQRAGGSADGRGYKLLKLLCIVAHVIFFIDGLLKFVEFCSDA